MIEKMKQKVTNFQKIFQSFKSHLLKNHGIVLFCYIYFLKLIKLKSNYFRMPQRLVSFLKYHQNYPPKNIPYEEISDSSSSISEFENPKRSRW